MHNAKHRLMSVLDEYFDVADPYTYNLTRVKTAHIEVGDFQPFGTDTLSDIADHLMERGIIVPPCPMGTEIYILVTRRPKVGSPKFTFIKNSTLTYSNLERVMRDLGDTVFLDRDSAEKKLEEMKTWQK